eukprot:Hpha_TRINITY_DN9012_c0_g1::TRINITY_DN9012_c0_g1_i1::g.142060::m.142060
MMRRACHTGVLSSTHAEWRRAYSLNPWKRRKEQKEPEADLGAAFGGGEEGGEAKEGGGLAGVFGSGLRWKKRWSRAERMKEGEGEAKHRRHAEEIKRKILHTKRESDKVREAAREEARKAKAEELHRFAQGLVHFWDDLGAFRMPDEELAGHADSVQRLHQGMDMTHSVLLQTTKRFGLEPFTASPGDAFDPALHQLEQRWVYRPANNKPIEVRAGADLGSPRTGVRIKPGQELIVSDTRLGHDDVRFLRLSEGGWLFDRKPGVGVMCEHLPQDLPPTGAKIVSVVLQGFRLREELVRKVIVRAGDGPFCSN